MMVCAAIVFAQATAAAPHAAPKTHTLRVPLIVWTAAVAADWATTYRFSTKYGDLMHEENPLIAGLRGHPATMIAAGSALDALTAWTAARALRSHPRLTRLTFYGAAAFRGYLAAHNIEMMRRAEAIRGFNTP